MHRNKRTPMYQSNTGVTGAQAYDFVDYTTPVSPKESAPNRDSELIRKIESLYKSQLLNIEQLKEQENHGEDLPETREQSPRQERVLTDRSNTTQQPFSKILRLETHQTLGTAEDPEESNPSGSAIDIKTPFFNSHLYIRKSRTITTDEQNKFQVLKKKSSTSSSSSHTKNTNENYLSLYSEFTSDDLINIMPDPYRSSLEFLKRRVRNNSMRMF